MTTAISSQANATFKPGLYGEGTASEDRSVQRWVVMALDRRTGAVVWQQTAYEGVPREKRHIKATYANATPATDGRRVVAFFGSQGLYAFDMDGRLLWKKDLGVLNTGAYDLPEYEWGTASSPIIYKNLVIVQCDTQNESFVLAADIDTGATVWKTVRKELPSWGTPTVYPAQDGRPAELITNASNFIRGYDPDTGVERWRLGGSSKITAPTPVFTARRDRRRQRPRAGAPGLRDQAGRVGRHHASRRTRPSNAHVLWSKTGRGSYMPTPLIYDGLLYVLANQGLLDAYDLRSGRRGLPPAHSSRGQRLQRLARRGRRPHLPVERRRRHLRRPGRPAFEILGALPDGRAADGHAGAGRGHDVCAGRAASVCDRGEVRRVRGWGFAGSRGSDGAELEEFAPRGCSARYARAGDSDVRSVAPSEHDPSPVATVARASEASAGEPRSPRQSKR